MEKKADDPGSSSKPACEAIAVKDEEKKQVEAAEEVPDPDEDDLDDLDDMLDDFSAVKIDPKKPAIPAGPTVAPPPPPAEPAQPLDELLEDDDFAQQLQAGMADLIGQLESSPEMQSQFETFFNEMAAAAEGQPLGGAGPAAPEPAVRSATGAQPAASSSSAFAPDASFQDTIRRTMERMQASGDEATRAATAGAEDAEADDFLTELLRQMQAGEGGGGAAGAEGDEDLAKLLSGVIEQMTNKDILYEPMKELDKSFPDWMEKNGSKIGAEDLKRFKEQQVLVRDIVAKFEEPTYTDASTEHREYIVEKMQKMQACGAPPADLIGEMPPGADTLGMDMPAEGCAPQ